MEPSTPKKRKMWPAILMAKCPRCRIGKIYANQMYHFGGQGINKNCSHCGLLYEREPGYFYSAMYVSYVFIVAELVTLGIGTSILTGSTNPWLYVVVMLSVVTMLAPFNLRYSRVLLLYWLTPGLNYQPELTSDKDI